MVITLLKRYDENGAWTHDMDVRMGVITPDDLRQSQWCVHEYVDIEELKENNMTLEEECENLAEENRMLKLRVAAVCNQN